MYPDGFVTYDPELHRPKAQGPRPKAQGPRQKEAQIQTTTNVISYERQPMRLMNR